MSNTLNLHMLSWFLELMISLQPARTCDNNESVPSPIQNWPVITQSFKYIISLSQHFSPQLIVFCIYLVFYCFVWDFSYLFLERGVEQVEERERNIDVWLPLVCPQMGTWPTTQACALIGNRTGDPLVWRLALSLLSHTSQGCSVLTLLFLSYFLEGFTL